MGALLVLERNTTALAALPSYETYFKRLAIAIVLSGKKEAVSNSLSVSVSFAQLSWMSSDSRRRRLRLGRTSAKENLPQLAVPERRIQFDDRGVNQKQNEDPDLYHRKAVPGEVS